VCGSGTCALEAQGVDGISSLAKNMAKVGQVVEQESRAGFERREVPRHFRIEVSRLILTSARGNLPPRALRARAPEKPTALRSADVFDRPRLPKHRGRENEARSGERELNDADDERDR
jgi:hypothetical protein